MHQLTCRDCRSSREIAFGVSVTGDTVYFDVNPNGDVAYVGTVTEQLEANPTYNPNQRYVCPDCGYTWTDRPAAKWENHVLSGAGVALILIVAVGALALGWAFWEFATAVALTGGVVHTTEQIRSAVEDWLDPVDSNVVGGRHGSA